MRYNHIFKCERQEQIPPDTRYYFTLRVSFIVLRGSFLRPLYVFRVNVLPQRCGKMKRSYVPQNANENLETLLLVCSRS